MEETMTGDPSQAVPTPVVLSTIVPARVLRHV
jgi:hypothetical protein